MSQKECFRIGQRVQVVNLDEEYQGLVGTVTDYIPIGSKLHDSGNLTDDVVIDFDEWQKRALLRKPTYRDLVESYSEINDVNLEQLLIAPEDLKVIESE
ncbi:hypothetical protein [Lentilactobacillus kisonensis]|nr:hypothetical protein [Lentilactobacillus kisonensis]KRL22467.1 hypothetical protein FC98_GL002351 [Lentilactobacillus kisonensis DSM 19906 = JCM 15041]